MLVATPAMPRIHYYVHGRGRGHATRSLAVITRLREAGHEVVAFAGADAEPLLHEHTETRPVVSLRPDTGRSLPRLLTARISAAVSALRRERAALIVSDGDLPGVAAARLARRPAIAVGHGLVFYCCARPAGLPADRWRREALKAGISTLGAHRRIAVNFVPLPVRRGRLARPPATRRAATPRTPDSPLLCYFRDGAPRPLLERLGALDRPVILFAPHDPTIPGIEHEPPSRARFLAVQRTAGAVVATAGSQLMSECVAQGTPLLALHAPDDDEQALNVAMLRRAGLGDGCSLLELDDGRLTRFLRRPPAPPPAWDAPDVATAVLEEVHDLLRGAS